MTSEDENMNIVRYLEKSLERRLQEMADPRGSALEDIANQRKPIREHFVKLIIYKNKTNDYEDWINTLANILNVINNTQIKTRSLKFKEQEYLKLVFGINNSFNEGDADTMIEWFDLDFSKKMPPHPPREQFVSDLYGKYKEFAHYFSHYLATCKTKGRRIEEFENKIREILEN